jgi:MOSC domain-containing protein YiiM
MRLVRSATLRTGVGIDGDKHAVESSKRQVLLADQECLDAVEVPPATIKENLTVEGLDVMSLEPGTRLRIKDVVLEITSVCDEILIEERAEAAS